jgi:hypothetical protein
VGVVGHGCWAQGYLRILWCCPVLPGGMRKQTIWTAEGQGGPCRQKLSKAMPWVKVLTIQGWSKISSLVLHFTSFLKYLCIFQYALCPYHSLKYIFTNKTICYDSSKY